MTDFYKRMTDADHLLTEAIQNGEGACRIAYLESIVEEARKQAEREEFEFLAPPRRAMSPPIKLPVTIFTNGKGCKWINDADGEVIEFEQIVAALNIR